MIDPIKVDEMKNRLFNLKHDRFKLDLKININVIRTNEFWDEFNNCMSINQPFVLYNEIGGPITMIFPKQKILRSYENFTLVSQTDCADMQEFLNNVKLAVVVFNKIYVSQKLLNNEY